MLKFLVSSGSKLNYRLYGEYLFDILFAGGVLGTYIITNFTTVERVPDVLSVGGLYAALTIFRLSGNEQVQILEDIRLFDECTVCWKGEICVGPYIVLYFHSSSQFLTAT